MLIISVGAYNITKTLNNNHDAWFHVGSENGFDIMYDGSTDQTTMMINGDGVYTKTEVDQKIAEAGGGGGGTVPDPLSIERINAKVLNADCENAAVSIGPEGNTYNGVVVAGGRNNRFINGNGCFNNGALMLGGDANAISYLYSVYSSAITIGGYKTYLKINGRNVGALVIGYNGTKARRCTCNWIYWY